MIPLSMLMLLAAGAQDEIPSIARLSFFPEEPEQQQPPPPVPGARGSEGSRPETEVGVEPFFPYMRFDDSLFLEDRVGIGVDVVVTVREQTPAGTFPTQAGLRLGYAGWNTETEPDDPGIPDEGVVVRQYRIGLGGDVEIEKGLVFSAWGISGVYRFRRDPVPGAREHSHDTSPYIEESVGLTYSPVPNVRFGLTAVMSHVKSSFNHKHTHMHTNYSIGPVFEVRW